MSAAKKGEGRRRSSADEIHRYGLAAATIPVEEPGEPPVVGLRRKEPTFSQLYLATEGPPLCLCRTLNRCEKEARLPHENCTYCGRPRTLVDMIRYYPCDEGWYTIRHQVRRCRGVAGMPDVKRETQPVVDFGLSKTTPPPPRRGQIVPK